MKFDELLERRLWDTLWEFDPSAYAAQHGVEPPADSATVAEVIFLADHCTPRNALGVHVTLSDGSTYAISITRERPPRSR